MEITTIQISKGVKNELEKLKQRSNESYEEVIVKLIDEKENNRKEQEQLMIAGYKEMAEESLKITKEFEGIEDLRDWEW